MENEKNVTDTTTDPGETILMGDIKTPATKKRAPRGTAKTANPLAEAKIEIKLLSGKVEMLDSQLKNAFARERSNQETIERLHQTISTMEQKQNIVARQVMTTLDVIRLGGN